VTLRERGDVIFVDGAAFSGTALDAQTLAAHPEVISLPVAARFHSDSRGMPALLAGRVGLGDFLGELRDGRWLDSDSPGERPAADQEAAITVFRDSYASDPLDACRALFWSMVVEPDEGQALIEASPGNLREAQMLVRLFPGARFLHVIRDGRDVAAEWSESEVRPERMTAGLRWWGGQLREIESGIHGEEDGARYALPRGRLAVAVLDELAGEERDAAVSALLEGLGLGDDSAVHSFAEQNLRPASIGRGRWRERSRGLGGWQLTRRYRGMLAELDREGNQAAPRLIRAYERSG
jgi:hypothetical protein